MADQTITPQAVGINAKKEVAAASWASLTAANAGVLTPPKDGKYLLLFTGAAGGEVVTIKAGTGAQSASQGDLVLAALTQNLTNAVVIESGRFKALSGTDIGKVRITVSAAVSACCIKLP